MKTLRSTLKMSKAKRDNLFFVLAALLMVMGGTTEPPLSPICILLGFLTAWFLVPLDKI